MVGQAQRFLSAHDGINNLLPLRRDHRPAAQDRAARTQAFQTWAAVTGVAVSVSGLIACIVLARADREGTAVPSAFQLADFVQVRWGPGLKGPGL